MGHSSNYPPSYTSAHVEAAVGKDGSCGRQSFDGWFECINPYDHGGDTHPECFESRLASEATARFNAHFEHSELAFARRARIASKRNESMPNPTKDSA